MKQRFNVLFSRTKNLVYDFWDLLYDNIRERNTFLFSKKENIMIIIGFAEKNNKKHVFCIINKRI